MKLRAASVRAYALPLARPVRTARAAASLRRGWWIRLEDAAGRTGWGEVACWPGFGAGPAAVLAALARRPLAGLLAALELAEDAVDLEAAARAACPPPELRAGIELALLDLAAQRAGLPLAAFLGSGGSREEIRAQLLVVDAEQADAAAADGVSAFKLKVGARDPADDAARVAAVRAAIGRGAWLVADANGGWERREAARALGLLAEAGADAVEQPLAPGDLEGAAALRRRAPLLLLADEAVRGPASLERVLAAGAADGVVIKPTACGGLLSARRLLRRARAAGLRVQLSHLLESGLGRAGALHLACAEDLAEPCGLAPVLARDVPQAPAVRAGALALPPGAGLGVAPEGVAVASGGGEGP